MADQELDQRIGLAELRGEMVQLNNRVDDVNNRINNDVNKRIDDVNRRIDDRCSEVRDLRVTWRWVIGIQVTMFIVLAGLILRGVGQ